MLRVGQKLLKYSYNGAAWKKYNPAVNPEIERKELKEKFQAGDAPEYLYDTKVKFDPDYKPYTTNSTHGFLAGIIIFFGYLTLRYERVRELEKKTVTHQYPV